MTTNDAALHLANTVIQDLNPDGQDYTKAERTVIGAAVAEAAHRHFPGMDPVALSQALADICNAYADSLTAERCDAMAQAKRAHIDLADDVVKALDYLSPHPLTKGMIGRDADKVRSALTTIRAAIATASGRAADHVSPSPLSMMIFCPACGEQHIDKVKPDQAWDNPPHRSHRCDACGHTWRHADVPTSGVERIKSSGKNDGSPYPPSRVSRHA